VGLLVGRHGKRTRRSDKEKRFLSQGPATRPRGGGECTDSPSRRRLGCRSRTGSVTLNTDELDRRLRALWKVGRIQYCLASSVIGPML
jgi:hypothetical protein